MGGKWESFDEPVTTAEFRKIPQPDRSALKYAMEKFGRGESGGWTLENYGDGLMMLKATNHTSGRCLFFTIDTKTPAKLVALLFYKKESNEAPEHIIATARERMKRTRG